MGRVLADGYLARFGRRMPFAYSSGQPSTVTQLRGLNHPRPEEDASRGLNVERKFQLDA